MDDAISRMSMREEEGLMLRGEIEAPRLVASRDPALIYEPRLRERLGGAIEVLGKRENPKIIPWGFWGGAIIGGLVIFLVFFAGSTGLRTFQDLFVFAVALLAGVAMFRLGPRTSLEEGVLCEIDMARRLLSWPTSLEESFISVRFDEVEEVVYGMTRYPVSRAKRATRVPAFTLLIRDASGQLVPIIEASTHKEETHRIAQVLSKVLAMPIKYVGLGIQDDSAA